MVNATYGNENLLPPHALAGGRGEAPSFVRHPRPRTGRPKAAKNSRDALARRIEAVMEDRFDEELEMEFDDARLEKPPDESEVEGDGFGMDRRFQFNELLRLQPELVKHQDWEVSTR
jgi:hypothetical protein